MPAVPPQTDGRMTWCCRRRVGAVLLWGLSMVLRSAPLPADDSAAIRLGFFGNRPTMFRMINERVVVNGKTVERTHIESVEEGVVPLDIDFTARWTTGERSFDGARLGAEQRLEALLAWIRTATRLSEDQYQKLMFAGRGDISRFLEQCESIYRQHHARGVTKDDLQVIGPVCDALQRQYKTGLHGPDSLFLKVLQSLVDQEEFQRVRIVMRVHGVP